MSILGKNIKKIRSVKKLSQTAFAELFDLTRASISAYEDGRSEPRSSKILEIANYFNISMEDMLSTELTVNKLANFDVIIDKNSKPHPHKVDNTSSPSPFKEIPFVSIESYAEYSSNYDNQPFQNSLPAIHIPFTGQETLQAFELRGDAMQYMNSGLFFGDVAICSKVESDNHAFGIIDNCVYCIVTTNEIYTASIYKEETNYTLKFFNPVYSEVILKKEDIHELWLIRSVLSSHFQSNFALGNKLRGL